jgi:small GTP-binding protein
MVVNLLEGPLDVLRHQEVNLLVDLATALGEMGDVAQTDRQKLLDVAQDLREMFFLVVIIGEFNAGKSSFVNALLGDDLLPMGITPTTEAIELIRYSETPQRKPTLRDNSLREWAHPNTGAPGVAIVDTPGTGSVFQKHETTAKAFLHRSDLVIFVVSAKRAFAETERLYLEMAKNYGKKIILVINQVDLLEPAELVQVRRFVEQQVKDLLDIQPLTFAVSAREAIKNRGTTNDTSGIDAVRAHLRGSFNEATPARQKMLAQLDMAQSITQRHLEAMQSKVNLVGTDTANVKQVQQELQSQSIGMDSQLRNARAEVDKVFSGIRLRGLNFINTHLSVRLLGSAPSKEKLQGEFQEVVIGRALRDINEATNEYVNAVVDHSRTYWRGVIDRLNQLQEILDQEVGGLDAGVYAQQREGLEEAIRVAESELKSYSTGTIVADIQQTFEGDLNSFKTSMLTAFSGLIVLIIAASSLLPGGLAPGILAAPALVIAAPLALLGGIAATRYYQRLTTDTKNEFSNRVDRLEKTYHDALDDLTRKERNRLAQYGAQVLTPVFSRLEALNKRYTDQQDALQMFVDRVLALRKSIETTK